jgi:hypothetical protein
VIYLYAITDRPGTPLPRQSLREVDAGGLAAVFTDRTPDADPSVEALWAHEEVVEALMHNRAVLPMRFGTCLRDEAAVHALLDDRRDEFQRMLDDVRGRVELGVRVAGTPAPASAGRQPSTGAEYMAQRLGARREAEQIAEAVHTPLARIAERSTTQQTRGDRDLMTASYLLPDDRIGRFTRRIQELQRAHPELALTCTGPWPPYSFVEESQE